MKNTRASFRQLLFSALLALPLGAAAQEAAPDEEDTEESKRQLEQEFSIGAYYLDEDAYRFGKYTGLTDEGYEPLIDFRLESRPEWDSGETRSWRLQGWRLGLDSRRVEFDFRDQGTQHFNADYREIPNNRFNDGMTPFLGVGTGVMDLPANWVGPPGGTTSSFATLEENLAPIDVGWERQRLDLAYDRNVGRQWTFSIDWRHEEKDGLRTFGGVIGNSGGNPRAVVLPAPMDWETDIMEAAFHFGNPRYQFGVALYASWFDNGEKSASWQNPYGQRSGWAPGVGFPNGYGLYSLEPDNQAMQVRLYGGINFSATSRLSADLSFGTMDQDDRLFDYSVNPALNVDIPLPAEVLDAEIETLHANIRYTARPLDGLGLVFNYSLDERENDTPRLVWVYIGGDSQNQKDPEEGRINLPYSYEKEQIDLTATWRATRGLRLKGGVEYRDYNREYSEVVDADETEVFAGIHFNRWEHASLSLDFATSERDVDEYIGNRPFLLSHIPGTVDEDDFENLPAMRKYNQTDRDRDEYRVRADFFPSPKFNFAIAGSWFEDEYNPGADDLLGLNQAEVKSVSFDVGFYPVEGVNLTGFYTVESYDADQSSRSWASASSAVDPDRNWFVTSEDDVDTWNVSLVFDQLGKDKGVGGHIELGMDYTYSKVKSDMDVTGGTSINAAPLPTLISQMESWTVFGLFQINRRSAIRLSYEKQELRTSDFALDDVPVDGPSNVLLLGQAAANYDLSLVMAAYVYRY